MGGLGGDRNLCPKGQLGPFTGLFALLHEVEMVETIAIGCTCLKDQP